MNTVRNHFTQSSATCRQITAFPAGDKGGHKGRADGHATLIEGRGQGKDVVIVRAGQMGLWHMVVHDADYTHAGMERWGLGVIDYTSDVVEKIQKNILIG